MIVALFAFISAITGIILASIGPLWFDSLYKDDTEIVVPVTFLCFILSSAILYFLVT